MTPSSTPVLGFGLGSGQAALTIQKGETALLAQEVRSPFAGKFRLTARLSLGGCSKEFVESVFAKNFTIAMQFYQYTSAAKSPLQRRDLGSQTVQPPYIVADAASVGAAIIDPDQPLSNAARFDAGSVGHERVGDGGAKANPTPQTFTLEKTFENPTAGANFSFGLGLGVALTVTKSTEGPLDLPADCPNRAYLRVHDFTLEFIGKERKENVTV